MTDAILTIGSGNSIAAVWRNITGLVVGFQRSSFAFHLVWRIKTQTHKIRIGLHVTIGIATSLPVTPQASENILLRIDLVTT
jgi:hypothetical protein